MHNYTSLDGPDFLEAVATAEAANANDINAGEYSRRAKQWSADLSALQQAQERCDALEERLRNKRRTMKRSR